MPEYIEREALMLAIEESYRKNPHSDPKIRQIHNHEHRHFLCLASKQPAANVVEVVRCKECKYCEDRAMSGLWCTHPDNRNPLGCREDDYCSDGERKEQTDE